MERLCLKIVQPARCVSAWARVCNNRPTPVIFARVDELSPYEAALVASTLDEDGKWLLPWLWNRDHQARIVAAKGGKVLA